MGAGTRMVAVVCERTEMMYLLPKNVGSRVGTISVRNRNVARKMDARSCMLKILHAIHTAAG